MATCFLYKEVFDVIELQFFIGLKIVKVIFHYTYHMKNIKFTWKETGCLEMYSKSFITDDSATNKITRNSIHVCLQLLCSFYLLLYISTFGQAHLQNLQNCSERIERRRSACSLIPLVNVLSLLIWS